ncbi:unnamed protein product [Blepharisma stoltei]|uniref:PiggyBac transposable element-derived protein domain-containing protein n=1 Tax=Blepharisma stoltei TaxID=1481888 RepID=A0AAU9IBU8_9CILI|nr:unnamed protein product [Blepharisma stoltei]
MKRESLLFNYIYDVTEEEIKKYIGLSILFGLVHISQIRNYWSSNLLYHNSVISSTMSRYRYEGISKILHLSPPSSSQWAGRLSKLSPIAEILCQNCKRNYELGREISIDESIIKYKGHHISKQYISTKPIKMRIQGICIVRFKKTRYLWNYEIYPGKSAKIENNIAKAVTLRLIEELRSNWHHIYCGDWYSSPELFRILTNQGFGATGAVRKNRKGLPKFQINKMNRLVFLFQ